MKAIFHKIKINKYVFKTSKSVVITKSYTTFTDTATIIIPNVLYKKKNQSIGQAISGETLINKGDPVKIWAGYDKAFDELPLLFTGFVTHVDANENITIKCEDYTYALKLINVESALFEDTTISNLIDTLLSDTDIEVNYVIDPETSIGDFKIENTNYLNVVDVLEELKQNLGITSYFDGAVLTIGKFVDVTAKQSNFIIQYNVVSDDALQYNKADDINQVIKGISIFEENEKIERYAYLQKGVLQISETPVKGEQITLHFYNFTEAQLEDTLTRNFQNYVYTGYSGNFQTYLEPRVDPCDKVRLWDLRYPERNGKYKTRAVVTEIDDNGAFQTIELDYRVG